MLSARPAIGRNGRVKLKVLPAPSRLSTSTRPCISSTSLTRDREAQPRTAILARRGGVCLGKCSKNRLELVRRNAASRVAHREPQLIDLLAALGTFHAHADLAPLGEFHCVANQVDQYLPQACRITPQHPGNVRVDVMEQFDALL